MRISVRAFVMGTALVTALAPGAIVHGQEATASTPQAPAAAPAQAAPAPDFLHQEEFTGDWGGVRRQWKDKGVVLDSSLTQFYQGVSSGGTGTSSEYNGTAQATLTFDFGKLAGWNFWSAEVKAETRFGGPLITSTGSINPVNTAVIIPGANGTVFALTAVNITKLFPIDLKQGKLFAVSFGRYNTIDLIEEHFFAGGGIERFMNMAQIGPLTVLREVPLVANALTMAYIRGGQPFFTFALMDPTDHSTDPGLSTLFADGVTLAPAVHLPAQHFGKTARHSLSGAVTTKEYTPFDAIRQIIIPGPPITPIEPERGSWSASYTFRQFLVEHGPGDGWGLFSQFALSNRSTSPISGLFDVGLGGNGLFPARRHDEFGVSYAFTQLSDTLKDNIDLSATAGRLRAEHQFEVFYNLHLTPWFQLTGDLQIIGPNRPVADTAIVPGARLRIVF